MTERQLFQQHLAPTTCEPMLFPIKKAMGALLYDENDKKFIDLIGGISVCNVGHCHPKVVAAIQEQAAAYLHVMVYGEFIQTPQVQFAKLLTDHLPENLNCVYFGNSGAEAVEGAMKLAKRFTGRAEIIACHNSYHGSTQGALSILGDEHWRSAYRPLLPGIRHIQHNNLGDLKYITSKTACIILEPIQAEAGVLVPQKEWMKALRERCDQTGTLLILDEIQTGFGRTGKLWAFHHFDIIPDVILLAKALGGGMPLGAFISSKEIMKSFAENPILGHLTTFGGHPVSCAAGKSAFEVILEEKLIDSVIEKQQLFIAHLKHPAIKEIRFKGLMIAIELADFDAVQKVIQFGLKCTPVGIFTDWFLFAPNSIRIVPPLVISNEEIIAACAILNQAFDSL